MMLFCLRVTILYITCTSFVFIVLIISWNGSFVNSFIFIIGDNLRLSPDLPSQNYTRSKLFVFHKLIYIFSPVCGQCASFSCYVSMASESSSFSLIATSPCNIALASESIPEPIEYPSSSAMISMVVALSPDLIILSKA